MTDWIGIGWTGGGGFVGGLVGALLKTRKERKAAQVARQQVAEYREATRRALHGLNAGLDREEKLEVALKTAQSNSEYWEKLAKDFEEEVMKIATRRG